MPVYRKYDLWKFDRRLLINVTRQRLKSDRREIDLWAKKNTITIEPHPNSLSSSFFLLFEFTVYCVYNFERLLSRTQSTRNNTGRPASSYSSKCVAPSFSQLCSLLPGKSDLRRHLANWVIVESSEQVTFCSWQVL